MPRLGELLVAAGLLGAEQVEQALRAQVLWGGRLGTNLVELHYLELDPLSRVLGRQHHLPAALARHFEKADPGLQTRLRPEIAERFSCLPLLQMGPDRHVVIAAAAPLAPRQLAIIADDLAVDVARLVPAIAAELRIRYQLERVYRIRRTARFLRARGASIPPYPSFPIPPVQPDAELDFSTPSLPVSTREIEAYRPVPGTPTSAPPAAAVDPKVSPAPSLPTMDPTAGFASHLPTMDRTPTEPDVVVEVVALGPMSDEDEEAPEEADEDAAEDADLLPIEVEVPAAVDEPDPVLEDDLEISNESPEDEAHARERRRYVQTIADPASADASDDAASDADGQSIGRIAIRKVAVGSSPRVMVGATLGEATRAIRRSTGRDRVADLVIDALDRFAPACEAAILLVVRGATAIGWKGFQRAGGGLPEIAVPMGDAGLVPRAVELNVSLRRACVELDPIDRLLLASLGRSDGDLVVVPIAIANRVMCVIALATACAAPIACAESIAAAAAAAFSRLMRDASR